ncbi:MAG TPA: HDOD domain-containing protein [Verrucomicrobiae bacterium]|jgi:putative nucleotidyltransferase with HDIG domain
MTPTPPANNYQDAVARKIHQERLRVLNPAKRYLDDVASLPPAPMLLTQLLTLFRQPDADIDHIVRLITHEPSLTAQILRASNSAAYSGEQASTDIFEAVTRMGFFQVYCLVVALCGARAKSIEGAEKGVNVDELWRHSVAAAVAASVVADASNQSKEVAFTAGLLHDIGKLVLASIGRERYAAAIQRAKNEKASLTSVEQFVFIIDHSELGGELMHRWTLPPDVVAAVKYHHDLASAATYEQLTAAVQLGDNLAHQLLKDDQGGTDIFAPASDALKVLRLKDEELPRLLAKAQAELENVKEILEL